MCRRPRQQVQIMEMEAKSTSQPVHLNLKSVRGLRPKSERSQQQARVQLQALGDDRSNFPGATGPGTGARHFPSLKAESRQFKGNKERSEHFDLKTTKDYYKEFPGLIRSSMPLYIMTAGEQEPLGKLEQALQDAGPETGQRRMPETVDREGRQRPRVSFHPDTDKSDLLRELDSRNLEP